MNEQEFINAILKGCLHLLFLGNKPRVENEQKSFIGLVERQRKYLSDKTYLNVLRAKNIRWVKVWLSIKQDNKVVRISGQEIKAERDNPAAKIQNKNDKVCIK